MKIQKTNHIAVWICVVAFQVISILWYSPLLFANVWMQYLGKKFEDFKGESIAGLFFSLLGAIIFCYFLSWLYIKLKVSTGKQGLLIAFVMALCCFCLETFTQDSFSLRPAGLSLINSGSTTINFCFAGLLLGTWKKYDL